MADIDLTINNVTVPTDVATGAPLSIAVTVTADSDAFAEGAAYSLLVYVSGFQAGPGNTPGLLGGAPLAQKGTLQAAPWTAPTVTLPFSLPAGPNPDLYTITAVLLAGPSGGVFQSIFSAPNLVVVHL